MALALTLLTGAVLRVKSFARLSSVDPGFDASNRLTFSMQLPAARYTNDTTRLCFWNTAVPRLAALPGVEGVTLTLTLPFSGNGPRGASVSRDTRPRRGSRVGGGHPHRERRPPQGDARASESAGRVITSRQSAGNDNARGKPHRLFHRVH